MRPIYTRKSNKRWEIVKDNKRLKLRKGDIIKIPFNSSYPEFAKGQLAVILDRYRIVTPSFHGYFYDYGMIFMYLTGKKKGEIRRLSGGRVHSYMKFLI